MPDLNDLTAALKMVRELPGTLWPEFQPANVPLVVWDGAQTTLFQSAAPPGSDWKAAPQGWTLPFAKNFTVKGSATLVVTIAGAAPRRIAVQFKAIGMWIPVRC